MLAGEIAPAAPDGCAIFYQKSNTIYIIKIAGPSENQSYFQTARFILSHFLQIKVKACILDFLKTTSQHIIASIPSIKYQQLYWKNIFPLGGALCWHRFFSSHRHLQMGRALTSLLASGHHYVRHGRH